MDELLPQYIKGNTAQPVCNHCKHYGGSKKVVGYPNNIYVCEFPFEKEAQTPDFRTGKIEYNYIIPSLLRNTSTIYDERRPPPCDKLNNRFQCKLFEQKPPAVGIWKRLWQSNFTNS